jgi:microcystin-dependent protein
MSEPYIGQIMLFGGNYAPDGYFPCDGRLLSIADYSTLFTLIGTAYGGDGQQTFALPDLRGRVSVGMGVGGGQTYSLAQAGGDEQVTLTTSQLPSHTHPASTSGGANPTKDPTNAVFADQSGSTKVAAYGPYASGGQVALAASSVSTAGQSQAHENRQPFLALTICIAWQGLYPTQA